MFSPNRRRFLQAAGTAPLSLACAGQLATTRACVAEDLSKPGFEIIDCHVHFYDPTREGGVPWPGKNDALLFRPMLPEHFRRAAQPLGVGGTVVVEASPLMEDNQWILDLAKDDSWINGLVGHLQPGSEDFSKHVRRFAKDDLFRGIRINYKLLAERLGEAPLVRDLELLAEHDLQLDVNGSPALLPHVDRLARKVPKLRVVINHLANVRIDGRTVDKAWRDGMLRAGEHEQVYCKVSALVEGTGRRDGTAPDDVEFYRPTLDVAWKAFGGDRLIYGSNWPVSLRFASYATVMKIVRTYFGEKGREASSKFFADNARKSYKWLVRKA